ncbi:MAG: RNA polymerase sigma factor [Acidothermaceae bacterium]
MDFDESLAAAQAGDEDGFAMIWRELHPPLVRYLRVLVPSSADDVASECWLQVMRSLGGFRGDQAGFTSWLFTIARSKVIDSKRRDKRRPTEPFDGAPGDTFAASDDTEALVLQRLDTETALKLIAELPAEQAEIIMLRVVSDLDVAAVASIVRKSQGAVRATTHRALMSLRRRWEATELAAGLTNVSDGEPLGQSGGRTKSSSKAVTA